MYFDTHAHYDDERYNEDREEFLASLPQRGVGLVVNPGCNEDSSSAAVRLAGQFPHIYAGIGFHPEDAEKFNEHSIDFLRELAKNPKVVAIGEIGLDYYCGEAPHEYQQQIFEAQLRLAAELKLPVIIHDREAHADTLAVTERVPEAKGVFHCYSGSAEMAKVLISRGWYLSFTGSITFKNARKSHEAIQVCPMDRIMIETDSPYLAPVPNRGKRNDSTNLPYIAATIAEIKGISVEEVERITYENGKRFFGIK